MKKECVICCDCMQAGVVGQAVVTGAWKKKTTIEKNQYAFVSWVFLCRGRAAVTSLSSDQHSSERSVSAALCTPS